MQPLQGLKRLLLSAWTMTTTGALAAEKFQVITTFTVVRIWRKTWRERLRMSPLLPGQARRLHEYQPTGRYQTRAESAVLANGMNLELWFQRFYQHLNGVPEVIVTQGISPMGISEGPYNGKPNPHAWMPDNALIYVDNIRDALVKYDPTNAQTYQRNAKSTSEKITTRPSTPCVKRVAEIPADKRWMVTSERILYTGAGFRAEELICGDKCRSAEHRSRYARLLTLVKKHQVRPC
jgi:manganese/iron transport system substrate-binding protein